MGRSTPELPHVPKDTNPELAIGKQQDIVIKKHTPIFNEKLPGLREKRRIMKMLEKIKDFFKLNCEVIGHSSAPEYVDLLNQILHDMGAVQKIVSGRPTVMYVSIYKLGEETIRVEEWEYGDILVRGRKRLIEEIKTKMTEHHESGGE